MGSRLRIRLLSMPLPQPPSLGAPMMALKASYALLREVPTLTPVQMNQNLGSVAESIVGSASDSHSEVCYFAGLATALTNSDPTQSTFVRTDRLQSWTLTSMADPNMNIRLRAKATTLSAACGTRCSPTRLLISLGRLRTCTFGHMSPRVLPF